MPEVHRRAGLLASALVLASACKKTENDWPETPPAPYTYADFSARLPELQCDRLMQCPPAKADVLLARALFGSNGRCTSFLTRAQSQTFDPREAIAAGRIAFHDDAAHAYLTDLVGSCDSSGLESDPHAGGALEGTVAAGGACMASAECEAGSYCEHAPGQVCPGTCTKKKTSGEACGSADECESTRCNAGICSKLAASAASGEPCGLVSGPDATETPCGPNLFCLGKPSALCRPAISGGSPCWSEDDVCVQGHLCLTDVDGTKRCRAVIVANEGELCTDETKSDIRFCDAFSNLVCVQGTCVKQSGAQGSSCVRTYFGDSCDAGLHCASASGVCEKLGNAGDPCMTNDQCASGWCTSTPGGCSADRCE